MKAVHSPNELRIGIDIGGTFTDVVAIDDSGHIRGLSKVPSTPPNFEIGAINGLDAIGLTELSRVQSFLHGTTVAVNALVNRAGAKTGLITTNGFRDILEIRRGEAADPYNYWWDPPDPLVPRSLRLEVKERVDYLGRVLQPLDQEGAREATRRLSLRGAEAVAVCFINSFMNPEHEQLMKRILEEEMPAVYVSASVEVLPEILEYERTSTTVANAYVGPIMDRYLSDFEAALKTRGYKGDLLISKSSGGVFTSQSARLVPAATIESGHAAGIMATRWIGRAAGHRNLIMFDMGGTTATVGAIVGGRPLLNPNYNVEHGLPVRLPCVDVTSIGSGGGTVAWVDSGGMLRVGPQSQGADPGPACYGKGGKFPTVTDAHIVLGTIDPGMFLGGAMTVNPELSTIAIRDFAVKSLGMGVLEAAAAIVGIAENNMILSMRRASVQRGYDPREFAVFAFGGAAPMHAADIARELKVPKVIVPPLPGLTSAAGLLMMDVTHELIRTVLTRRDKIDPSSLHEAFLQMEKAAVQHLEKEGVASVNMIIQRFADLRYYGQSRHLTVEVPSGDMTEKTLDGLERAFLSNYQREFGYTLPPDYGLVEIANLRVVATGNITKMRLKRHRPVFSKEVRPKGRRRIYFVSTKRSEDTIIYDRTTLGPGVKVEGPAVVEQMDTTILVPAGLEANVDPYLNFTIDIR